MIPGTRSVAPRPSPERPRIQLIGTCARSPADERGAVRPRAGMNTNWANAVGLAKHYVRVPPIKPRFARAIRELAKVQAQDSAVKNLIAAKPRR